MARDYVSRCGVRPSFTARLGPLVALMIVSVSVVLVVFAFGQTKADTTAQIVTALVAVNAALLGSWQWAKARQESAIDKYYDRLALSNEARLRAANCSGTDTDTDRLLLEDFYVFSELDNLEYCLCKYTHGCMNRALMNRALATFENRCQHLYGFRDIVAHFYRGASYAPGVLRVVEELAGLGSDGAGDNPRESIVLESGRAPTRHSLANCPPSATTSDPETNDASSDARKATTAAI